MKSWINLCVLVLLCTTFGTSATFVYDDSLTFATGVKATEENITLEFKYESNIAAGTTIEIDLPNFSGSPTIENGTSCGGTANDGIATAGSGATYSVTYTLDSSTGYTARGVCKIIIGGVTLPATIKESDLSTYVISIASGADIAISRSDAVTGILHDEEDTITFSKHAVGTAVDITYSFKYNRIITTGETIVLNLPFFTAADANSASSTSVCGTTTFTFSSGVSNPTGTASTTVTATLATADLGADTRCTIIIKGLSTPSAENNFAANYRKLKASFVPTNTAEGTKEVPISVTDSVGVPSLYSMKSECRLGGVSTGTLGNCDNAASCLKCTTTDYSFYKTYGTSCKTTSKVRCDARVSAQTSVDIYFSPNGVPGTVTCGAFVEDGAPNFDQSTDPVAPTTHISGLTIGSGTNDLYSRNSAVVTSSETKSDHVITLNRLKSDTLYHVYCHSDDFKLSEFLDVHTLADTFLSGISLTVSTLTGAASPGTLTLKFTHGVQLSEDFEIEMITSPWSLFGSDADAICTATSGGSAIVVKEARGATTTLTYTVGSDGSAAGNEIAISCTGNLASNPASGAVIKIASLKVFDASSNLLSSAYGLAGYTTT